jgi:hypothetical protein
MSTSLKGKTMADSEQSKLHESLGRPLSVLSKGKAEDKTVTAVSLSGNAVTAAAVFDADILACPEYQAAWMAECGDVEDPAERALLSMKIAERISKQKKQQTQKKAEQTAVVEVPAQDEPKQRKARKTGTDWQPAIDGLLAKINKLTDLLSADAKPVVAEKERELSKPVETDFSQLGIPGLSSNVKKPEFKVEFGLGEMGKMQARYHWVGVHNDCVFLIYDTRFEYGMLFEPPVLGPDRSIVLRIQSADGTKEYSVVSVDIVHPFGVFYIITLPVVETRQAQSQPVVLSPPVISEQAEFGNGVDYGF